MAHLLNEHVYRGVRAFFYQERNNYRVMYLSAKNGEYIGDMPVKGLKEPWSIKEIEHSIDVLYRDIRR